MRTIQKIDLLLALLVFVSLLLASCAPAATATPTATSAPLPVTSEPLAGPRLRITNAGETDIRNLTVLLPHSRIFFGDVPVGATTDYQPAPQGVYSYAAFEFDLNGETLVQPAIDWIGASPLPGQSYTYVIELDPSRPQMQQITLVEVKAELNN